MKLITNLKTKRKQKEIDIFAEQKDFSAILLNEAVNEYEYSGNIDRKSIGQNISEPFMKRKRKPTKLYSLLKILLKNMVWLNNFIKSLYFFFTTRIFVIYSICSNKKYK